MLWNFLLECGVDVDIWSRKEETPFFVASRSGMVNILRFLIENNADIHATDEEGWDPLHIASLHGHLDVVRLLVEAGTVSKHLDNFDNSSSNTNIVNNNNSSSSSSVATTPPITSTVTHVRHACALPRHTPQAPTPQVRDCPQNSPRRFVNTREVILDEGGLHCPSMRAHRCA